MKELIKKILKEYSEEKILVIPSLKYFGDDWNLLKSYLQSKGNSKGNPKWKIMDDLYLSNTPIKSLGNLQSVKGNLNLINTPIESLGNLQSVEGNLNLRNTPIESLGNLQSVGGYLDLANTPIKSLGNLQSVKGYLDLFNTPISKKYTKEQIREMVNVEGGIYL